MTAPRSSPTPGELAAAPGDPSRAYIVEQGSPAGGSRIQTAAFGSSDVTTFDRAGRQCPFRLVPPEQRHLAARALLHLPRVGHLGHRHDGSEIDAETAERQVAALGERGEPDLGRPVGRERRHRGHATRRGSSRRWRRARPTPRRSAPTSNRSNICVSTATTLRRHQAL